jgi:hypothetical protein
VATGILSEGNVSAPLRDVLRHHRNARVVLAEVSGVDLERRTVVCTLLDRTWEIAYDSLIVAAGSAQSYFGHDEFSRHAPGMKTIDHALEVRGRIFGAFELAEFEEDPARRTACQTFVVRRRTDRRGDGRPDRRAVALHPALELQADRHRPHAHRPRRPRCADPRGLRRAPIAKGDGESWSAWALKPGREPS